MLPKILSSSSRCSNRSQLVVAGSSSNLEMVLEASEDAQYDTAAEARDDIGGFAESDGYAVKMGKSRTVGNRKGGDVKNFELICAHGGKHIAKGDQLRNRTTARTNCPFKVVVKRNSATGKWNSTVVNPAHNHEPAEDLSAYPSARAFTEDQLQLVTSLLWKLKDRATWFW